MAGKIKFRVLEDKPLENIDGDYFGHQEIANSIIEVIKEAPKPFNIGLYGQWGVGKTTICKIIKDKFSNENEYEVVYFDTWKYQRDSFRRQFLINLDQELRLNLNYKEKLNQSLSIPYNLKWMDSIKLFLGNFLFRTLTILIFAFIAVLIFRQFITPILSANYIDLAKRLSDLGIIGILITFILESIKQFQGEKTFNRTDSAEGFEEYFIEVLSKIQKKNLILIIDNLDRLSSVEAVRLLGDIKTFLSDDKYHDEKVENKTVFIMPCDNKALNDQLSKEYGPGFDTEEYLRKLFNYSFKIPKFLNIELDKLIIDKLNQTLIDEFHDNYDLVFILSYAFRDNPREIIQFINSLISLYLLAKERGISRIIERDHIAFLAKVLVLRMKWPTLYTNIENHILRTGDKLSEIVDSLENSSNKDQIVEFLERTSPVNDEEYQDIYFSIRQSDEQKMIPEWDSFVSSLLDGRIPDANKIYESIKSNNKIEQLGKLIIDYCRRNQKNENLLFNIFLSSQSIIPPDDLKHFQEMFLLVFKNIHDDVFVKYLDKLNFNRFFSKGLQGLSAANKKELSSKLVSIMNYASSIESIEKDRIKFLKTLFEVLNSEENKGNFNLNDKKIVSAKNNFIEHIKYQTVFPESEKGANLDINTLKNILDVISALKPFSSEFYRSGIYLLNNLLGWPPLVENDDARILVLEKSLDFLDKQAIPSRDDGSVIGPILNTFTTRIFSWYSAQKTIEERSLCIKIFQKINVDLNPSRDAVNTYIKDYVADTSNNSDIILKTLGKEFLVTDSFARSGLIERTKTKTDLLIRLSIKNKLTDDEKALVFNSLLNSANEALIFLEYINYKLPHEHGGDSNFLKNIISRMINSSIFTDAELLNKWLEAINKLVIPSDLLDLFTKKMRQAKTMSDQHAEVISDFISKNSKIFGDLIVNEFKTK